MEKLQAAIAQARAARAGAAPRSGPRPAPPAGWGQIHRFTPDPARLARERVVAMAAGPEAAPVDMLRTRILQQMGARGWTRLAVTSPDAGAGKTTAALNLAASLARQGAVRAVVMEMDMRRPAIARRLGLDPRPSVFDLLEGRAGFAAQAVRLSRSVAVSANRTAREEPAALLLSRATGACLDAVQRAFAIDLMIFDLPPFFAADDAAAFLPHVDCALILAAAGRTRLAEIERCERELAERTDVLGVVINELPARDAEAGTHAHA